jgi:hypothetical protein
MIYVVVRKTIDWSDESAFRAQIPDGMRAGIALWDGTFTIPYRVYRRELKRIAQSNLAGVDGAQYAPLESVPSGAVTVPVDDDDWFAPDLANVLEAGIAGHAGCYWPSRYLEVPISLSHRIGLIRRTLFPRTRPRWLCTTNNYAVVYGAETAGLLRGHIRATQWFLAHPAAVTRIERPLSLMNRSLASTTQLSSRPSRALLLRKYRRYYELYSRPVPPDLGWCEPYLAMMRNLHSELRVRRS